MRFLFKYPGETNNFLFQVSDGELANAATFNSQLASLEVDNSFAGKQELANTDVVSGATVLNVQEDINGTSSFTGKALNTPKDILPVWTNNDVGTSTDNLKVRADSLTEKFNSTTGHAHSGAAGDGALIDAGNLDNVNNFFAVLLLQLIVSATGSTFDVSTEFAAETPGGDTVTEGVVTTPPQNQVAILDATNQYIEDAFGNRVYGRLTWAAGVWTLSFFVNISGTETSTSIATQNIQMFYKKVFNQANRPTFGADIGDLITVDVTADVMDATATQRGVVSTGTQSFGGNKTFTGTIAASNLSGTNTGDVTVAAVGAVPNANAATITGQVLNLQPADASFPGVVNTGTQTFAGNKTFTGSISASNISGTNSGDVTLAAIGATPNANGASLSGQTLNLQPADGSFGGVVSTIAQSFAGLKTFVGGIVAQASLLISGVLNLDTTTDSATTGSLQTLSTPVKTIVRVTNAGLVSVEGVTAPTTKQQFVLMNVTGVAIDLVHLSGTAANQIHTGSGADLTMENGQAVTLIYDLDSTVWRVIGGGGSGGGGTTLYNANFTGATITATADAFQKFTYTGTNGVNHQLTALNFSAVPDGGRLIIEGTDNTNVVTIVAFSITDVRQNGDWMGAQYSMIEFMKSGSLLIEVSRNGT